MDQFRIEFSRVNGLILATHPHTGVQWVFRRLGRFLGWCAGIHPRD